MTHSEEDRVEPRLRPDTGPADGEPTTAGDADPAADAHESAQGSASEHLVDPPAPEIELPVSDLPADAQAEIEALREQVQHEQDRYLRAVAEMENVRRRAAADVSKAHKFSIEQFAESLIPVKDSLEMALNVENPDSDSYREGIEATLKQLTQAFEKNKLSEIDPVGQKFDPNLHQAISMVPASATNPPIEPNHVASVLQKGYLINDRVLRPALVTVVEA